MVTPFFKAAEKPIEQRVGNRLIVLIRFKAALGGIGDRFGFMNEYMVPWLISLGLGLVGLIPILTGHALGIMRDYHTTIMVTHMAYQFARRKLGRGVPRQFRLQHDHGE